MDDKYLMKLENAQTNYNTINPGFYHAYVRGVQLASNSNGKMIEIYLEYINPYNYRAEAIVAHYYFSGNSRYKSIQMLLPVMRQYVPINSKYREVGFIPNMTDDAIAQMLMEALYHQLVIIEVELYDANKKNIRVRATEVREY